MITQNKLYWREQTMEDKKEKLPSTRIQWDIRIFRKVDSNY